MALILLVAMTLQTACGTIFYPERRGQEPGKIDPAIVILNGVGLLFFLLPGVIAFAVDFSTGAIYLPPDESSNDGERRVVHLDPDEITPETLAALINEHTGKTVTLTERDIRVLEKNGPGSPSEKLEALSRQ